jgi:hypothetical protein
MVGVFSELWGPVPVSPQHIDDVDPLPNEVDKDKGDAH